MLFGALLSRLSDERSAAADLEALGDLVLYVEVEQMGARFGESVGEYAAGAARRFAAAAPDEDWVALMGAIERSTDPARTALARMLRWALARDTADLAAPAAEPAPGHAGCSCGGGGASCHGAT